MMDNPRRAEAIPIESNRYQVVSGVAFVGMGAITILGFITAEALFPGYSTSSNTISALGAARGTPASRAIFNPAMVISGGLLLIAGYSLHQVYNRRLLTSVIAITGVGGFMGVGLFPSQAGLPHFIAAMIAFIGVGLSALAVATTVRGPFGYVSATLGILELIALVLFMALGGSTPLGIGGLERWVAYLGLVWATTFGGFLLATGTNNN